MPFFGFLKDLFGSNKKKKRPASRTGRAHTPPPRPEKPEERPEPSQSPPKGGAVADTAVVGENEGGTVSSEPVAAKEKDPANEVSKEKEAGSGEEQAAENPSRDQQKDPAPPPKAEKPEAEKEEVADPPQNEEQPRENDSTEQGKEEPTTKKENPPAEAGEQAAPEMPVGDRLFEEGKKYLGTPYVYGGTTPEGFDCSGFVVHTFERAAGIDLPRTSRQQAQVGKTIDEAKAQKGDLVFFSHTGKSINHVGIIVSDHGEPLKMIHASSSQGVIVSDLATSTYWKPRITNYQRVLEELG